MDFDKAKEDLEKYVEDLSKEYDIKKPRFSKRKNNISIVHEIENNLLNRSCIPDIFDLVKKIYYEDDPLHYRLYREFTNYYYLLLEDEKDEFVKKREIGVRFQENFSTCYVKFGTNMDLDYLDLKFNKEIYSLLLPAKTKENVLKELEEIGITAHNIPKNLDFSYLAGYEDIKGAIEMSIVLPFKNKEIYKKIVSLTRKNIEDNIIKTILFEGPAGTGKTESAKILSSILSVPLVYFSMENIFTKWYGESQKNTAKIFDIFSRLERGILFLDEIDCLVGSREGNMHEETKRVFSVLLKRLDDADKLEDKIIIGATNRFNDLDPAIQRRFKKIIHFRLPNFEDRIKIYSNYAKHLDKGLLEDLAKVSDKFSGDDIKSVCLDTENQWAEFLIKNNRKLAIVPIDFYKKSLEEFKIGKKDKSNIGF